MLARILTVPPLFAERYPARTIASVGLLFALAYGASLVLLPKPNGQIVLGDAIEHYVQLRSLVFDRDLQFLNDYAGLYRVDRAVLEANVEWKSTPTGHMRNYMPVGPALLWAPLFLLTAVGVWAANLFGAAVPLDGFARPFQAAAGFSGVVAAAGGSWLAFRAAATLFDRRTAIWATLTVWLSSSAIYYSLVSPAYSHAASMLVCGAFWYVWLRTGFGAAHQRSQSVGRYALVGFLAGVAALMRWQDAVLLAVPLLDALWHRRERGLGAAVVRIAAATIAAAVAFLPQMAVWQVLYGRMLTVPQGPGFMRWHDPALLSVLFSDNHGLITWTPIVALALAGLGLLVRRAPLLAAAALAFFVATWVVNAAVADWWAGEAFGARRFISCFPIFVLGLAALFDRLRTPGMVFGIFVAFTGYTALLLLQYQAFMHRLYPGAPYPRGFADLWLARFRVPFELLSSWLGQ